MSVTFREITEKNFEECIGLKVRDDQRFVASNVYSIAQAKVEPIWVPLAIYAGETMVGFIMYALDYPKKELYVCRLMIDQRYQHRGYGRAALAKVREIAMQDPGIEFVGLSTNPDNAYGIKVYETFGFKDTGTFEDNEKVFVLDLGKHRE